MVPCGALTPLRPTSVALALVEAAPRKAGFQLVRLIVPGVHGIYGPDLKCPVLMIEYTGDNSVFPSEAKLIFEWLGTSDKVRRRIRGNHHGRPVLPELPNGQLIAGDEIRSSAYVKKMDVSSSDRAVD